MPDRPYHVAKFGGTSVGTPERVRRVVALATSRATDGHRRVVVSSAFGGVTDRLLAALDAAETRSGAHREILAEVRARHTEALALAMPDERDPVAAHLDALFTETAELVEAVYLLRECTPRVRDAVVSAGERASVPLVAAAFRAAGHAATAFDATALVRTDGAFGEAAVDFATTGAQVRAALGALHPDAVAVVTGFVASTADGVTTTLGRSGSDYTATILAGAVGAAECVIWTDVDGVLSADPRVVSDAFSLPHLSYAEAAELAHFGAKVLHPRTMRPLAAPEGGGGAIPLRILNTLRPEAEGTVVGPEPAAAGIKAVTAIRDAALVRVAGAAVLEVPELAARVFAPLAADGVPVFLVAQASAEGSLCLAVRSSDAARAVQRLRAALAREIERGDVLGVRVDDGLAVVAAVGAGMQTAAGMAGRMFATLARAHVNVRALAQGGGDHALSCVVADGDAVAAVRALHEAFARGRLRAHLVVVGVGALGRRFLALAGAQQDALAARGIALRLAGVAASDRRVLDAAELSFDEALDRLADAPDLGGSEADRLDALVDALVDARLERLVVVDATPSAALAARHADLLAAGVAVVTPNKAATAQPADTWRAAHAAARAGGAPYLYESAVGAGLGVVARLRDLLRTGDRVRRIEGVLSGTLAFVMSRLREGVALEAAVAEARAAGLTEPDPSDDLSGRDVARKLTLLAREMGLDGAVADVQPLADGLAALAARGEAQYVARLSADGTITARVEAMPPASPLAGLRGAEVGVAFWTERTGDTPLVLRGPAATADITAAVLLADVVRAAEAMR